MIKGVFTALITPFNEDGSVDYGAYEALVHRQIEQGIDGLVPIGTTAESPTLEKDEKVKLISIAVKIADGKIPVIVGSGSNSTKHAIEATKEAKDLGASMSLQVSPYYNKPTLDGLYQHFSSIAESVDLDMMIYNIPGRTGVNIPNSTLLELAKNPRVKAIKEASGNMGQVLNLLHDKPSDLAIFSGDDAFTLPMVTCGGQGIISVASNMFPSQIVKMTHLLLEGKLEEGIEIYHALYPFFINFFLETNPIPVKTYMAKEGLIKEYFRLPMTRMSSEAKKILFNTSKMF